MSKSQTCFSIEKASFVYSVRNILFTREIFALKRFRSVFQSLNELYDLVRD